MSEKKAGAKPVECLDLEGNLIKVYASGVEAGKDLNIPHAEISYCCRGIKFSFNGYRFRFKGDLEDRYILQHPSKAGESIEDIINAANQRKVVSKAVECLDMNGNVIKYFRSGAEAASALGLTNAEVSQCCRGLKYSANNMRFRFAGDTEDKFEEMQVKRNMILQGMSTIQPGSNDDTLKDEAFKKRDRTNNAKSVECLDLEGNVLHLFKSGLEASLMLNVSQGDISQCCRGVKHSFMGYRFRFYGDIEDKFEANKILKKGFALVAEAPVVIDNNNKMEPIRTTRASRGDLGNNYNKTNELETKTIFKAIKDIMVRKWRKEQVTVGSMKIFKWVPESTEPNPALQQQLPSKSTETKKSKSNRRKST